MPGQMKNLFSILFFTVFISLMFFACKKYPEGGLKMYAIKHLVTKTGCAWNLTRYEVNNIDSTNLVNTCGIQEFYKLNLQIFKTKNEEHDISIHNIQYIYKGYMKDARSSLKLKLHNKGVGVETREILNPENVTEPIWLIEKLKKDKLILIANWSRKYRLIFEKKEY
jgi:hypothetical protein